MLFRSDGLIWFIQNCFDSLLKINPALKLKVVGIWTKGTIGSYSSQQIEFAGFVPNLETVLENSIMIVPLRIGSGMRMKIIESILYKIPFITTSIGVEGLNFKNNEDCFIADTALEFVEKSLLLMNDKMLQKSFIENSYNTLLRSYSYDKAMEKRQNLYDDLLN